MSTKIHATCDALGNPTALHLTPGQKHDLEGTDIFLLGISAEAILADKAYNADLRVLKILKKQGQKIVIPPKKNHREIREHDKETYKVRHLT